MIKKGCMKADNRDLFLFAEVASQHMQKNSLQFKHNFNKSIISTKVDIMTPFKVTSLQLQLIFNVSELNQTTDSHHKRIRREGFSSVRLLHVMGPELRR